MVKKILVIFCSALLFVACTPSSDNPDVNIPDHVTDEIDDDESTESMSDIIENIASPLEMANLIQASGVPFSLRYLAPTEDSDKFNTNFKKALALGVMASDLGYLNMYKKSGSVINYLRIIQRLSSDLRIGQFFDFKLLKDLAKADNVDSLMYHSTASFNRMDKYLRENGKGELSALMVAGVWIEGMYIATQVMEENSNQKLIERIGEQKVMLNLLVMSLSSFQSEPNFPALITDFKVIQEQFTNVQITYEIGLPETIEEDGKLIIIQDEKSIIHITEEHVKLISEQVEKVRNKLISL